MKKTFTIVLALMLGVLQPLSAQGEKNIILGEEHIYGHSPDLREGYILFDDLADAINYLINKKNPAVIGFGEIHEEHVETSSKPTSLSFLFQEALPLISRGDDHLIVEKSPSRQVLCNAALDAQGRVRTTLDEKLYHLDRHMATLYHAEAAGYSAHLLDYKCSDWHHLQGPAPDSWKIVAARLTRYTEDKIQEIEKSRTTSGITMYYGGALHNDVFPRRNRHDWSFANVAMEVTEGRYLEIDLYVPETMEALDAPWLLSNDNGWYGIYNRKKKRREKSFVSFSTFREFLHFGSEKEHQR